MWCIFVVFLDCQHPCFRNFKFVVNPRVEVVWVAQSFCVCQLTWYSPQSDFYLVLACYDCNDRVR